MENPNWKLQTLRKSLSLVVLPGTASRLAMVSLGLAFGGLGSVPTAVAANPVSFSKDIAPILADKCLTCHQEKKAKGGYRVDSFEQLGIMGDSEETALVAGQPGASTLYTRLVTEHEDDRMPANDDPLPAPQIALVKRWIEQGGKFDGKDPRLALHELAPAEARPGAPEKYPRPLPVTAAVFGIDGETYYTSGYHEVLEWQTADGKLLRRLAAAPERVLALALQPDGRHLAVAGGSPGKGGEVVVYDRAAGKVVQRLPGSADTFLAAAFSPDSSLLAISGTDNTIRVFRTTDWKQAWQVEAHADWVTSLTFAPDGKHLVSTSRDRTAKILASADGSPGLTYSNHGSAVTSAVFDDDGVMVTTAAADGEVRRWKWDATIDGGGRAQDKKLRSRREEVTRLAVKGTRLVVGAVDGRLRVFDLTKPDKDPVELKPLGVRVDALAMHPSGTKLLAAGQEGRLLLVDLAAGERLLTATAAPGW
jgi:dipeptidyl aminopeptidase/acylaminoacyl peptidase